MLASGNFFKHLGCFAALMGSFVREALEVPIELFSERGRGHNKFF